MILGKRPRPLLYAFGLSLLIALMPASAETAPVTPRALAALHAAPPRLLLTGPEAGVIPGAEVQREADTERIRRVRGRLVYPGVVTAREAAEQFLAALGPVIGVDVPAAQLGFSREVESLTGHHLTYQQVFDGRPVIDGQLSVHTDNELAVVLVNQDMIPITSPAPLAPAGDSAMAVAAAIAEVGAADPPYDGPRAEPGVWVLSGRPLTVWQVRFATRAPAAAWRAIVEAASGRVIVLENTARYDQAASSFPYAATPLGDLGRCCSSAQAGNGSGQVTGSSTTPAGVQHAFRWDHGSMADLGQGTVESHGWAINSSGDVAGWSYPPPSIVYQHATLFKDGLSIDLGSLGGNYSLALGINGQGQVTGNSTLTGDGVSHGFVWTAGAFTDIGTLGGDGAQPNAINSNGDVVGWALLPGTQVGAEHAFLWSGGSMTDLGTLGGFRSNALDINDSREIVGSYDRSPDHQQHAVVWRGGAPTDIGTLPGGTYSNAYAVNNRGQVVGSAQAADTLPVAFLWSPVSGMQDLNAMVDPASVVGCRITSALDINDCGEIVAIGNCGGGLQSWLLSPAGLPSGARGLAFDPDPVTSSGDPTLTQATPVDQLDAQAMCVGLPGLTDTTSWTLTGQYADTALSTTFTRASEPGRFYGFARTDHRFHEVMAYLNTDAVERYLQSLGFTGAKAINSRPVQIAVDQIADDNSFYAPDGHGTGTLTFGTGGVPDAEDAMVIWHENGHAIQDNQVPGWGATEEGGAMGEGFGDYLAASWFAGQGPKGSSWDVFFSRWDGTVGGTAAADGNPAYVRRLDSKLHYPEGLAGEVHADGEIWSAVLWQIRGIVGPARADKLIIESQFMLSPTATFADGACAILDANQALYTGTDQDAIRKVFTDRGILSNIKVKSLKLSATTVAGCKSVNATIKLSKPAPAGGARICLESTNTAAQVPSTVTFPAGKSSVTVAIPTTAVTSTVTGTISALSGGASKSAPLTVRPFGVESLVLSAKSVVGPGSVTAAVTLECPVSGAIGSLAVAMSSSDPATAAPDQPTLVFAVGEQTRTMPVNAADVARQKPVTISASANGTSRKAKLTVK